MSTTTPASNRVAFNKRQAFVGPKPVRELDSSLNKNLFLDMNTDDIWPVYKGDCFDLWRPDTGECKRHGESVRVLKHLQTKRQNQVHSKRSVFYGADQDWADDPDTLPCNFPRVVYRCTTGHTNHRTCIVCLIPPKIFLVHSVSYLFFPPEDRQKNEAFTLGIMSSVPFDWYIRRVVGTYFSVKIFKECPFPRPSEDDPLRLRIIELAGRLAAVDKRYEEWAQKVGVPVASANSAPVKAKLIAELDAAVALLYSLDENDLRLIWETFHTTINHLSSLDEVLGHHRNLQGLN